MTYSRFLNKIEYLWNSDEKSVLTGFIIFLILCILTPFAMIRLLFLFLYNEYKKFVIDLKYFKN